jgi:hypothetical protein
MFFADRLVLILFMKRSVKTACQSKLKAANSKSEAASHPRKWITQSLRANREGIAVIVIELIGGSLLAMSAIGFLVLAVLS